MHSNTPSAGLALLDAGDKSKILGLTINSHAVEPGQHVPRQDAQQPPQLHIDLDVPDPDATYMVIGLDLDAPLPSLPLLSPILHWVQAGLKPARGTARLDLHAAGPELVRYSGPGPPPGSAPHRYCFYLYKQPDGFDAAAHEAGDLGLWQRVRVGLGDWERKLQLGPIVAASYFRSN